MTIYILSIFVSGIILGSLATWFLFRDSGEYRYASRDIRYFTTIGPIPCNICKAKDGISTLHIPWRGVLVVFPVCRDCETMPDVFFEEFLDKHFNPSGDLKTGELHYY